MNNIDLSTLVTQLLGHHKHNQRQLEEYLLSFWLFASQYKDRTAISTGQFIELLELAFIADIPAFQNEWRSSTFDCYSNEDTSYLAFEETILEQIVDLREMDETDLLSNELRYFGIDSPRGNRWFNFSPSSYLECAAAGLNSYYSQVSWKQIKEFFWCGQIYE